MAHSVESNQGSHPKEYKWPAALFGIGVAIYLLWGLVTGGVPGMIAMGFVIPIRVGLQVILGVVACFITAKIMDIDFGQLTSAIVKLAAVFVFPSAVTFFIPWVGWILALILYWKLLEWLFDLEGIEPIVLTIVIFVVNFGAVFLTGYLGFLLRN